MIYGWLSFTMLVSYQVINSGRSSCSLWSPSYVGCVSRSSSTARGSATRRDDGKTMMQGTTFYNKARQVVRSYALTTRDDEVGRSWRTYVHLQGGRKKVIPPRSGGVCLKSIIHIIRMLCFHAPETKFHARHSAAFIHYWQRSENNS